MENIADIFGSISIFFLPYILKFAKKVEKRKRNKIKIIKEHSIFWLCKIISLTIISIITYKNENKQMSIKLATMMIFLMIFSYIFIKQKYYIHHLISIISFFLLAIIIDILLDSSFKFDYTSYKFYLGIIIIPFQALLVVYIKYMMEKLFYHYWQIALSDGLISLIFLIICIPIIYANKIGDYNLSDYFENVNIGFIILRFFVKFLFSGFLEGLLIYLTLYYFYPNYYLISYWLANIIHLLIVNDDKNRYYCIIPFIFQFISLLFYLEIFEYNFWGLNKNTRKNIQSREKDDNSHIDAYDIDNINIDVNSDFFIEEKNLNEKELNIINKEEINENINKNEVNITKSI